MGDILVIAGIGALLVVGVIVGPHVRVLSSFGWLLPWLVYSLFLAAGGLLHFLRAHFNRRAVVVNYRGVTFENLTIPARFIPWSDIARVRFDWKTEQFRIEGSGQAPLLVCKGEELSTNRLADECAYVINDLKAVYAESSLDERCPR